MTAAITTASDGLGGLWVYAGTKRLGRVFPAKTTGLPHHTPLPDCIWFGRLDGTDAKPFDTEDDAHAYVCAGQDD